MEKDDVGGGGEVGYSEFVTDLFDKQNRFSELFCEKARMDFGGATATAMGSYYGQKYDIGTSVPPTPILRQWRAR